MQSFGVYQNYYTLHSLNDHPPSDISWIGSVQACLMFGGGIISGKLFDTGLFRYMLAGGSLLFVFSWVPDCLEVFNITDPSTFMCFPVCQIDHLCYRSSNHTIITRTSWHKESVWDSAWAYCLCLPFRLRLITSKNDGRLQWVSC